MSERSHSRLAAHLLRVSAYAAGIFWLAFVYGAWVLISTPETGRHSHAGGWTILVVAAVAVITTMDHWVKYLRVIFGGGILGGILATGSGHLLNGKPFPRSIAAGVTALFIASSLISQTLANRKLRALDRIALIAFLAAFVGALIKGTPTAGLVGTGVGFVCLAAAWGYDRHSSRNGKPYEVENPSHS